MAVMRDFLPLAMKEIQIKDLPKIKLVKYVPDAEQPTFGKYDPDNNLLFIALQNRHPLDILRTFAHELVHYKQGTEHELGPTSGQTGSPQENQAHEIAGIIMRNFNKQHPEYFKEPPISLEESAAWHRKAGKSKTGGLNKKGVASYRREHPGSHLQTAVTIKPSKLKKGSKAAKRRKSFCARMKGMKKHRTGSKTAHDPNSRINKSLRKWHCESIEEMRELIMLGENYISNLKQLLSEVKATHNFDIEDIKRLEKIRDLATLKTQAFELISKPSAKPMKPEKVAWFRGALEKMDSPMKVIKLMYDLYLSGQGHAVIGSRNSMASNNYRAKFGEQGVAEGITPNTIHKLADRKGIKWDDEPSFLRLTKRLTGKAHLDDLNQTELAKVKDHLENLDENFANGKNPGRKGIAKRSGVNTNASVSSLRRTAKHSSGEKARIAHWLANMKAGKAKANKK